MQKHIFFHAFIFAVLCLSQQSWGQEIKSDSLTTPFQQGRWLTGLSGSFSSNTNEIGSSNDKYFTNTYSLELETGKFFKDRWLFGGVLIAVRGNGSGNVERDDESLFIGPSIAHYFSKSSQGSLFLSLAPGYVRFRNETTIIQNNISITESIKGPGFGLRLSLGYSYVIKNRFAFDIGLNLTQFWLNTELESFPGGTITSQNVSVNGVNFSFGFNVLLDDFFF